MNQKSYALLVFLLFYASTATAEEGYLCSSFYQEVQSTLKKINDYGTDLSQLAKNKLLSDLQSYTSLCISACENEKFEYCNDIAKQIEKD